MVNGWQIRLSILRKEVHIGILAVPDHLFDDGAQQAAFFLQRGRIHRAGEGFDHLLMEGKLLMEHPALLGEGFQLGKSCLLSLALPMQFVDLLHDVLCRGVAGNGQGLHQPLDAVFRLGVFLPEQRQLCIVALLAAADNLLGLRQQPGKGLLVGGKLADLLDDLGIQRVAVAVFHAAHGAVAALLGGAHVGIDQLTVRILAVGQLRAHIVAAFAAAQQPGQQRHIAAGPAVALGFVDIQHGLHPHPIAARDDARMLTHRHDPFLHGTDLIRLAGALERAVVCHDAVLAVELGLLGKQVYIVFFQILIRRLVGDHVDRVCENAPDGKAGELLAALRDATVLQQVLIGLAERAGLHEHLEDRLDQLNFLRDGSQLVGLALLAVHGHAGFALGSIARGRCAAQPAPGLGQLVHVVPDALGDGLPLQLGEHGRNVHHGAAHGRGRVELLADGDEVDVPVAQVLDELGKVANVAADAVEAVNHDGGKGDFLRVLHHFLELRALQIAAGKALVLVDQHVFRRFLAKVHGNVLTAQLDLVLDAFALAGEFGLAGVDDVLLRRIFRFHGGTSRYSLGW